MSVIWSSSTGSAGISLLFTAISRWARIVPCAGAYALTRVMAG
jgi:hypothetical protein